MVSNEDELSPRVTVRLPRAAEMKAIPRAAVRQDAKGLMLRKKLRGRGVCKDHS